MKQTKLEKHINDFHDLCTEIGSYQLLKQKALEVHFKSDRSPVTDVDIRSSEMIVNFIRKEFPDDIIVSEENSSHRSKENSYWLIDPIDGTKNYIKGGSQFCICISKIINNYPVFGIIYIPSTSEFYYAIKNNGCKMINNNKVSKIIISDDSKKNIFLSSSIKESVIELIKSSLPSHTIIQMSSAIKFTKLASNQGVFSARLGPTYEWDTAAGQCIIEESGGIFLDREFNRFSYGLSDSFLNGPFFVLNKQSDIHTKLINDCLSLLP